jgi:hypothetical protein
MRRPAQYPTKAAIQRAVETFRSLGLEPGGYRVAPDGTIDVYAASQKADNDDFDAQFKERL